MDGTSLDINEKVCPRCKDLKTRTEFHVESARKDKMSYRCKECQSVVDRERHSRERDKRLKQQKAWYQKDPKSRIQKVKDWIVKNPERRKATKRKNDLAAYGLTVEQFEALSRSQGDSCAICHGPPAGKYKILVVDHDHKTDKVRGLLCSPCNMGIGLLKDDPIIVLAAAEYLRQR